MVDISTWIKSEWITQNTTGTAWTEETKRPKTKTQQSWTDTLADSPSKQEMICTEKQ